MAPGYFFRARDLESLAVLKHIGAIGAADGLATVQELVRQHGGSIYVQSEEGQGSIFTVRLPVMPLPPETSGPST